MVVSIRLIHEDGERFNMSFTSSGFNFNGIETVFNNCFEVKQDGDIERSFVKIEDTNSSNIKVITIDTFNLYVIDSEISIIISENE